jgi:hypothetical protein
MSELAVPQSGRSPFDAIKRRGVIGGREQEVWSARELVPMLGYANWKRIPEVLDRVKASIVNAGHNDSDHLVGAYQMIGIGKGATRQVDDFHLSRYACYLVAMNGDPRKPEIAAAQAYFCLQTYRAEKMDEAASQNAIVPAVLGFLERMEARAAEREERLLKTFEGIGQGLIAAVRQGVPALPAEPKPLTNAEKKRRAVEALKDPKTGDPDIYSNRDLARLCGVTPSWLGKMRKKLVNEGVKQVDPDLSAAGRNGARASNTVRGRRLSDPSLFDADLRN